MANKFEDKIYNFDLKILFLNFRQNKLRYTCAFLIGLVFGALSYSFSEKKWKGEFQIVVDLNKKTELPSIVGGYQQQPTQNFLGLRDKNALKTEIEILKSPSVLMPIFNFVKSSKLNNKEDVENLKFSDWYESNVDINLIKGTSILNLSYEDNSKDLIKDVLTRISKTYQDYSQRDKFVRIQNGINYLNNQIELYNVKTTNSLKEAQSYAIEQDLTPLKSIEGGDDEIINFINIEDIKIREGNKLRNLQEQEKQLIQIKDDPQALIYFGSTIPELVDSGLPAILKKLDSDIALRKLKFTENDKKIKEMKSEKLVYTDLLLNQVFSYLSAKKISTQAKIESVTRPKGVVIKYKSLLRKAQRDNRTLVNLENDKRILTLELAKFKDPWELITSPTVFDAKSSPSLKKYLFFSILFFLFLAYLSTLHFFMEFFMKLKNKKFHKFDDLKSQIIKALKSFKLKP